ncbi:anaerobic ribonucleoside-triphosphate reductase activating protein [Desulfatirhabdium butyrativorans]|uniref:anaerobic ribonucleoside-triphosphate reductase activating protein n=1 Tax=Desulfatirhabdium butyrativorans TaxID=340467 RepID=UPI000407E7B6|nr:anaerobic ribonucleoside-triphosphate reductase activating protein [Desulfatirhabdium butyrativorans]
MNIAGLQKHSLIDYPGKVACVVFFAGCNFRCPYCHNADLARGMVVDPMDLEAFWRFLEKRRGFLDGVVVSGGEPTLQKELPDFCRKILEMGFSVKLDTNGSRPDVLTKLLSDGVLDFIAMDIKTDPERYVSMGLFPNGDPACIYESIECIQRSGIAGEFRTTCVAPFVTEETFPAMLTCIAGADRYVLQPFVNRNVLDPEWVERHARGLSSEEMARLAEMASGYVGEVIVLSRFG